jgi:serine protease DegQ
VLLAAWFVVATLKPEWLNRRPVPAAWWPWWKPPGSFRAAAQKGSGVGGGQHQHQQGRPTAPPASDPWFRFFFGDRGPSRRPAWAAA